MRLPGGSPHPPSRQPGTGAPLWGVRGHFPKNFGGRNSHVGLCPGPPPRGGLPMDSPTRRGGGRLKPGREAAFLGRESERNDPVLCCVRWGEENSAWSVRLRWKGAWHKPRKLNPKLKQKKQNPFEGCPERTVKKFYHKKPQNCLFFLHF